MPAKKFGVSTVQKPIRLPPLNRLNVKGASARDKNPCLSIMSSVLTCWASNGFNVVGCQNLETQLRSCMDTPNQRSQKKNTLNYHLARMLPNLVSPKKR
ncbi:37S ribosomal protein mrp10, mitochondrial [Erysiphe neolycopersici]|uniref:Small ribosomal subunit protein mS37 n=1 Tax=Erysiphe neolycopersici TaxID=212602 RepID=A0A420HNH1_9PEZI|nr:37S ribosomal protein mrp10, mitochondrial [Erysiphe neolycopersici]